LALTHPVVIDLPSHGKSCLRCKYTTTNAFQLTKFKQTAQVGRKAAKAVI